MCLNNMFSIWESHACVHWLSLPHHQANALINRWALYKYHESQGTMIIFQFKGSKPLGKHCSCGLLPLQLFFKPRSHSWESCSQSPANLHLIMTYRVRGNAKHDAASLHLKSGDDKHRNPRPHSLTLRSVFSIIPAYHLSPYLSSNIGC